MHPKVPAGFGGRLRGKGPRQRDLAAQPILSPKVLGQHPAQMVLIDDQQPVEQLPAQGADDPFADGVAPHRQLHPVRMIGTGVSG